MKNVLNFANFRFGGLDGLQRLELDLHVLELRTIKEITSCKLKVTCALVGLVVQRQPADDGMRGFDVDEGHLVC